MDIIVGQTLRCFVCSKTSYFIHQIDTAEATVRLRRILSNSATTLG